MKTRKWIAGVTAFALVFTLATFSAPPKAQALTTEVAIELITTGSSGVGCNGYSWEPTISADGTKIVFDSDATDLIVGMTTNGEYNVFLYDASTTTTTLITTGSSGNGGNATSGTASISADGSKIAFSSRATDLITGVTTNGEYNLYLYDIASATTTLITTGPSGIGGDSSSSDASLSADGNKIAFESNAKDLIAGIMPNYWDNIYLYDVASATTTLVTTGIPSDYSSYGSRDPSISADGTKIVFDSQSPGLITGMTTNRNGNIFLYDINSATTTLVTTGSSGIGGDSLSSTASISADGTKIVFWSWATDLIAGITHNHYQDIYLYDAASATITLITRGSSGIGGDYDSGYANISDDGSTIVILSQASDLITGMTINGEYNVFHYDVATATMTLVTTGSSGVGGNGRTGDPSVSADGTMVVFGSLATDLIPDMTTTSVSNIFLANLTFYANVTFDPDNGDPVTTEKLLPGATVGEPADPVKEGFVFSGWFTSAGEKWDFDDPVDDDMTLTAHWAELITITLDLQNGEDPITIEVAEGQPIAQPADPVKEGFIFEGWFTSDGIRWDFDDPVIEGLTLVAHWVADEEPVVPEEPEEPEGPEIPQTGDILLLASIAFMVLAGCAIGSVALLRKRRIN